MQTREQLLVKLNNLVLTLSGKMDVSIAASAMKNFETLSNFYCAAAAGNEGIINEKILAD